MMNMFSESVAPVKNISELLIYDSLFNDSVSGLTNWLIDPVTAVHHRGNATTRAARFIEKHCITYRNATVMEITTWAQEYFQKTLSVNTIRRAIRRCWLKLYRSKKKPYLNMIQKRRRFLWAKAHLKWTVAKWKTVLWSDESKFEVLFWKTGTPCHPD